MRSLSFSYVVTSIVIFVSSVRDLLYQILVQHDMEPQSRMRFIFCRFIQGQGHGKTLDHTMGIQRRDLEGQGHFAVATGKAKCF